MASALVDHVVILMFVGLLVWAAVCDFRTYLIPNSVSISVAALFPAHVLASPMPVDWLSALVVAAAVLATGIVLFAFRVAGGGDVKLLAATALWAGSSQIVAFLLVTSLVGGVLAGFIGGYRYFRPWPSGAIARDDTMAVKLHASVPYGIAIASGGLWLAAQMAAR